MVGMQSSKGFRDLLVKTFGLVFVLLGIMNILWVHSLPGLFYLILASVYLTPLNDFITRKLGSSKSFYITIIFGFFVLWGTLAVGDLAETAGL